MGQPNIIFITSHDMGDWLGCYQHPTLNTPHLDAFANDGCLFSNAYCTSPVCTPSRGAMMTGRYPQSNGLMSLIQEPYSWRLNSGEKHLSHLLHSHGYRTVLFNHQHEAPPDDNLGFQEQPLKESGWFHLITGERIVSAVETAEAVTEFLEECKDTDSPFYAQIGMFETHTPFDWSGAEPDDSNGVEIKSHSAHGTITNKYISGLQGAISYLDKAVGQILKKLASTGLDKNTIVVFTSDHGVELPRCKWQLYDGGLKTALLMRWPEGGVSGGTVCNWQTSNIDILPTLLDLANLPIPENVQGKSFASFFRDEKALPAREITFGMMHAAQRWTESRSVRSDKFKLIRNFTPSRMPIAPKEGFKSHIPGTGPLQERPVVEMYDLAADPQELNNLGIDPCYRAVRENLDDLLLKWLEDVDDPILRGPVITPYHQMATADLKRQ